MPDFDRLLGAADRRWRAIEAERPDIAAAVALQRLLVARSFDLGAMLDEHAPARLALAPAEAASRLKAKRSALPESAVEIEAARFEPFVLAFCDDLARGGAGRPAERVRGVIERREIDLGSLLAASLMRRQQDIRTAALHAGIAPDLLWLTAELGAAPLAHRLQRRHVTGADAGGTLRAALDAWDRGNCPACGSWPALAEVVAGDRRLRCSFCGAAWGQAARRCIYCGEDGEALLAASAADGRRDRIVELCRKCRGYLKRVTVDGPTPFELLPVEDLASSDLDAGAAERGYARPPMPEVGAA